MSIWQEVGWTPVDREMARTYTAPRDRTRSSPMEQITEFGPGSGDTSRTLRHVRLTRAVLFDKEALIRLVTPLESEWIVQRAATLLV